MYGYAQTSSVSEHLWAILHILTFRKRWIRPTGNCKPALTEREVGLRLSPFLADIVPFAPFPERPFPESPFAPLPDIFVRGNYASLVTTAYAPCRVCSRGLTRGRCRLNLRYFFFPVLTIFKADRLSVIIVRCMKWNHTHYISVKSLLSESLRDYGGSLIKPRIVNLNTLCYDYIM